MDHTEQQNLIISKYGLLPHIEGGFYSRIYRSPIILPKEVLPSCFQTDRNAATSIYYLLPPGISSKLHRLCADEIWHFYSGSPLLIVELHDEGQIRQTILGNDLAQDQVHQYVVPAGCWFGAKPLTSSYAFVGITLAPGIGPEEPIFPDKGDLLQQFPQARPIIEEFLR